MIKLFSGITTAPSIDNATVLLSSDMNVCLPLRIVHDTTVEGPEEFLLNISSALDGVRIAQSSAFLTITDDDSEYLLSAHMKWCEWTCTF